VKKGIMCMVIVDGCGRCCLFFTVLMYIYIALDRGNLLIIDETWPNNS